MLKTWSDFQNRKSDKTLLIYYLYISIHLNSENQKCFLLKPSSEIS